MADNNNTDNNTNGDSGISRRTFIKNTGLVTGGIVGGGLLGGILGNQWQTGTQTDTGGATDEEGDTNRVDEARMFFTRDADFNVLSAATERIFPEDDNGPGAIGLGVPYFIDRQLAGSWGDNIHEYMQGPFSQGEDSQGFQSALTRGQIFLQGVRQINEVSQDGFGEAFADLEEEQQNEILSAFEDGEVDMRGVTSPTFFNMLLQGTLQGAYSDPLYGGNRNMDGWRMKEYPGPVMSYMNEIEEEEFIVMDPISISDHHTN
ncbi:gluconate 2-dehydrogenase subunit 3 family protein [Salicibibacter cibarius]|uniref:Gluconate 2-dehydrogenase subunit 3 family protein n=1 Tax=Salicibibacter cibarius TaxID=2743000 RepID=A0A7T6Z505_9BACI|nr:gluconate 2-dehydrogenase subunit 3 family protein [Salicibibacter cibarius]QQK76827.1 gluconate 2-dehydrogenase subunit 3 family protein [Salicibibacter cibarius]